LSGSSDDISVLAAGFRGLLRRRLVILGGPGSGKTTLAVQLLLDLLATRQSGEPIPVLISLAGWDPSTHPQLHGWLGARLAENYPSLLAFGPDVARALVEQGHILPILDGFDEAPAARQPQMLLALNASLTDADPLVLISRTREYHSTVTRAQTRLTAAAVIEPEPLTASEVAAYLKDLLPRQPDESWPPVLAALVGGTAGALAEVVSSPLGLWLLRVVYIEGRCDPRPLIDTNHYSDEAAIQHHLLHELIPAAVRSRPPLPSGADPLRPKHHYDPEQVRRWLTALAVELRDAKTRD
jgi:hypothetical protein